MKLRSGTKEAAHQEEVPIEGEVVLHSSQKESAEEISNIKQTKESAEEIGIIKQMKDSNGSINAGAGRLASHRNFDGRNACCSGCAMDKTIHRLPDIGTLIHHK